MIEFKKAWAKMLIACLCFTAMVLLIVVMILNNQFGEYTGTGNVYILSFFTFSQMLATIGMTVFFAGMTAVMICKIMGEDLMRLVASWILLGTGVITTLLFILYFALNVGDWSDALAGRQVFHQIVISVVAPMIVFGLIPIVRGIKKLLFEEVRKNTI